MKLKSQFQTHDALGEHYLVPLGDASFKGIVKGNETAAFIWECLKEETTEAEIVNMLAAEYSGAEMSDVAKDVAETLERLRFIGALEE